MKSIAEIDKNFAIKCGIDEKVRELYDFYDIDSAPFSLHGVFREGERYVRMPLDLAESINLRLKGLSICTAGGRVRFVTDSPSVALVVISKSCDVNVHFAYAGKAGFDIYASDEDDMRYFGTYLPPLEFKDGFEGLVYLEGRKPRTVCINFPLYNGVRQLFVGIERGSSLQPAEPLLQPPVVYYGSSITQGGCASRPGNCYQAMLHRHLKRDYVNLGFSGNAMAEEAMMDYIASLDMGLFVYDYDHNSPNDQHLAATHHIGYKKIRAAHPDIPIIMMTRPKYHLTPGELGRNAIIRQSFEKGLSQGDKNLYFVDGRELLLPTGRENSLVDNCHPTDLGFYGMAERLLPLMKKLTE